MSFKNCDISVFSDFEVKTALLSIEIPPECQGKNPYKCTGNQDLNRMHLIL